ncbi:hypothetical protein G5V59_20910 [Nocardioides sp. W3-2-3]|uniref:hypothetical protein n=1 Tax=Nocardioides convexus TaxID=2712224 RepID=UPI0024187524|nr:hypothetical protein [Nocardioides convexus]NHA01448.1 hypothetical protein [Nocardioides convexus]
MTVPASLLAAGLGVAMLQGMVGAVLASADGFTLNSDRITSDGLKARTGAANVAGGNQATIYAETGSNTNASGIQVVTPNVTIPLLNLPAHLEVKSTDTTIALGSVGLNAKTLNTPDGAELGTTTIGVAQSEAGFANKDTSSGYVGDAFALTRLLGGPAERQREGLRHHAAEPGPGQPVAVRRARQLIAGCSPALGSAPARRR